MSDLLGDGIFAVDGEKWRQQRKIASFEFSTKMLRDYSSQVFRNSGMRLTEIISDLASSNQMMDIQVIAVHIFLMFFISCSNIDIHHFSNLFSLFSSFVLIFIYGIFRI
jgi:cytochrome P450